MILGIMQPYFFPHLGYFDLIHRSDRWIVFDKVKYIRHGWINRNRIHHPDEGWQYIVVPLKKHASHTNICDIQINEDLDWKGKLIGQLQHYKKASNRFLETIEVVQDCLESDEQSLSRLNASILDKMCAHLGIEFKYQFLSEMKLELEPVAGPGDWALNISAALGASGYVNPSGGEELFDAAQFKHRGINLEIRDIPPMSYESAPYEFIPRLSIIDLLMWNSPEAIHDYLDQYRQSKGQVDGCGG